MPIKDMLEEPEEVANGHDFIKMAWDICRTDNVLFCEFLQLTDFITPQTFPNIPLVGQLLLGKSIIAVLTLIFLGQTRPSDRRFVN